jgi:hypothetical protein
MTQQNSFGNVSGSVNTGSPVNRGGNQVIGSGSIHVSSGNQYGTNPAVLEAIAQLRAQLDELPLRASDRNAAAEDLEGVEHAGGDQRAAANAFESFLLRLKKAGALAQAGAEFTEAARKITTWLGPLAVGALAIL